MKNGASCPEKTKFFHEAQVFCLLENGGFFYRVKSNFLEFRFFAVGKCFTLKSSVFLQRNNVDGTPHIGVPRCILCRVCYYLNVSTTEARLLIIKTFSGV